MTIKGYCRTNLDDYDRENWPEEFSFPPRIGDRVESKSGSILYVVGVTHKYFKKKNFTIVETNEPFIEVELHRYESVCHRT